MPAPRKKVVATTASEPVVESKTAVKNPRLLMRGDIVSLPTPVGTQIEGIVAGIDINVRLDSGFTVTVPADVPVTLASLPVVSEQLEAQVSAIEASPQSQE